LRIPTIQFLSKDIVVSAMTHREISELRKLGDHLVSVSGAYPNRFGMVVQELEKTLNILSGPILTAPVYTRGFEQGRKGFDYGNSRLDDCGMKMDNLNMTAETLRVASRLGSFDWRTSRVWKTIREHFGTELSLTELRKLLLWLAEDAGLSADRDAKRRKSVLLKWMDENWSRLSHFLINYGWDAEGNSISRTQAGFLGRVI
jgi:hypothetical protein